MNARRFKGHPQSAPGDFYVVNSECLSCGVPHALAPTLMGWAENIDGAHCIWKRRPETAQEIEDAIGAVLASEVACHRYAGDDLDVINRLGWEYCDSPLRPLPELPACGDPAPPSFGLVATGPSLWERTVGLIRVILNRPW